MKNHPIFLATSAAAAGVLLGGFVVMQLLGTPVKKDAVATTASAPAESPPAPHIADTNGSASPDTVASTDCAKQTWPNLTRDCMKNGGAVAPADAAVPAALSASGVSSPTPVPSDPPPLVAPPIATVATPPQNPEPPAVAPTETASPVQAAEKTEAKPKPEAKKFAHKARKPARREFYQDGDGAYARDDREVRGSDRSRRVARWADRDRYYGDPDDEGYGRRRVFIQRDRGGGSLFGGFDDDD